MGWHPFTGGRGGAGDVAGGREGVQVARGERGGSGGRGERATELGHDRVVLQRRTGERGSLTCGASATVPGGTAKFDSISNFKRIQIIFEFFQDLTDKK
jgi:hypothetical protein